MVSLTKSLFLRKIPTRKILRLVVVKDSPAVTAIIDAFMDEYDGRAATGLGATQTPAPAGTGRWRRSTTA